MKDLSVSRPSSEDPERPSPATQRLSLEEPLACACAQSGLQVQVSTPEFLLLHCPRCQRILAGRPVLAADGSGYVERLPLSAEEEAQVHKAVRIGPDTPLVDSLQHVLACTLPAALRVAQQRLGQRPELLKELRGALFGTAPQPRFLTLQLVARMPEVPRELRPGALHAIQCTLTSDPLSEEVQGALMALHPLAAAGLHLRGEAERVGRQVELLTGDRAALTSQIARAVVAAIDRAAAVAKERFAAARDHLATLVRKGQLEPARALLAQVGPDAESGDPDGGTTGRLALCEAAAEALLNEASLDSGRTDRAAQRDAVRTLLAWALDCARALAAGATAGGEGMAGMVAVHRLQGRLKRLG